MVSWIGNEITGCREDRVMAGVMDKVNALLVPHGYLMFDSTKSRFQTPLFRVVVVSIVISFSTVS